MTTAKNMAVARTCCGAAIACLVPVALYQLGALRTLPDPPSPLFDSDLITGSKDAHPLGVPDGLLGLASYASTLALLLAAGRGRNCVLLNKALKAKLAMDAGMAGMNSIKQVVKFHRLCSWCMGTALATAGMVCFARHAQSQMSGC